MSHFFSSRGPRKCPLRVYKGFSSDDNPENILYNFSMKTYEEILEEAEHLPLEQRLSLAHRLLVVGELDSSPEIDKAWDLVIRERIAQYDQGQTHSRPVHEIFSELGTLYK